MPIYDMECEQCNALFPDKIMGYDETEMNCEMCGGVARRIITASGVYIGNQDADWIKSVTEVVNKDDKSPHTQEFLKNPTRKNYQNWMKGEGLRPFESGEKPRTPPKFDHKSHREKVWQKHRDRKRIEVRR